jgi:hypothetical protein
MKGFIGSPGDWEFHSPGKSIKSEVNAAGLVI